MKSIRMMLSLALVAVAMGCVSPEIPKNTAKVFNAVCDRHDALIQEDLKSSDVEKNVWLMDTKIVRMFIEENAEK
ncbi:MAG: hypothetical protein ABIK28_25195 [Planctomycetota bacterium]